MAGAIGIAAFYLNFIFELLGITKSRKNFLKVSNLLFFIFFLLNLTPLMVAKMVPEMNFQFWPKPGIAFHFFLLTWFSYIIYSTVLLYKGYRAAAGVYKQQIKYILIGLTLGFLGGSTNYFLWYGIQIPPIGNIFASVFIIFVFYSIFRYKFFNIKIIATELFVLGLIISSVWQFFIGGISPNIYIQFLSITLIVALGIFLIKTVLKEVRQREQLQQLSKELEQANIQLKQLDQAKSEFLSVASHQLRTPLTAIKGYVSMLLSGDFGKLDLRQEEPIKIIYDSSQRLVELITDLLDLSRIESGTMEFNFAAVDLGPIIESVIEELKQKAQGHNLYLYFDNVHTKCPEIRADKEKIRQVIINLIDNAIKYTTQGGVTLRLHNTGRALQLEVSDTGIGIDPADQKKIFQKFFRTDAANEITREGTGLGIYVVKKLVEVQGGKIWFDSKGLGKGTTFYVSFPLPKGKIVEETLKIKSLEAF